MSILWPAQTPACVLYQSFILRLFDPVFRDPASLAFFSHPFRDSAALLLYHGKVLVVLVSVEKQFASV